MTFQAFVTQVEAAAARLRHDRDAASHQVDALLEGGWRGAAADAYAEGWAEWHAGAEQVLAGLETMTRLLDAVEVSFIGSDDGVGSVVDRIAARLGDVRG